MQTTNPNTQTTAQRREQMAELFGSIMAHQLLEISPLTERQLAFLAVSTFDDHNTPKAEQMETLVEACKLAMACPEIERKEAADYIAMFTDDVRGEAEAKTATIPSCVWAFLLHGMSGEQLATLRKYAFDIIREGIEKL